MSLNNTDFQRLLQTNDEKLVKELTRKGQGKKRKRPTLPDPAAQKKQRRPKPPPKEQTQEKKEEKPLYRDRAKERQRGDVEYKLIEQEWEQSQAITADESKYLGGDLDHTHMVKGIDFALLSKVRNELNKHEQKQIMAQKERERRLAKQKRREFLTVKGRQIYEQLIAVLHPHHRTFKQRMAHMEALIARGHRLRGSTSNFLPGRMTYVFEMQDEGENADLPTILYRSAGEVAQLNRGNDRKHGPIPKSIVDNLKGLLEDHALQRKQRRKDKQAARKDPASYTVQRVEAPRPARPQARDKGLDIFDDAGKFDATALARKSQSQAPARQDGKKRSYFDDAGRGVSSDEETPLEFEAASSFKGARPGWVFKKGSKGLGYYQEQRDGRSKYEVERDRHERELQQKRDRLQRAEREQQAAKRIMQREQDGAYDELFPESRLVEHNSRYVEEEQKGNRKKKGGQDDLTEAAKNYGKRGGEPPRKAKMSTDKQWAAVEKMIEGRKGGGASAEDLVSSQRKSTSSRPSFR